MRIPFIFTVAAVLFGFGIQSADARLYIDRNGNWTRTPPKHATMNGRSIPREEVRYDGSEKPGTIIVDTSERRLYYVLDNGRALKYGVGVGRAGFEWQGTHRVSRKAEWPTWTPSGRHARPRAAPRGASCRLPCRAASTTRWAPARFTSATRCTASTGTNNPRSIGLAMSSGCIRMVNDDVIDLEKRVRVGAKVIVRH